MDSAGFQQPLRRPIYASEGMIACPTPQAALAGFDVLRDGGNAVDAAISAIATASVVESAQSGLAGDCFALVAVEGHPVRAFNGSGRAPAGLSAEFLLERGIFTIGRTTPHAVTIPGAVDAWCQLHRDYGLLPFDRLLAPAIRYAEDGYIVQPRVAFDWAESAHLLMESDSAQAIFMPNGHAPRAGDRHHQPLLGATLRSIAAHGRDAFYLGPIAEDIVEFLRSRGGQHALSDFAEHRGEYLDPIQTRFFGHDVYECPPNGQGLAALLLLNLLRSLQVAELPLDSPTGIHLLAEATKIAFAMRDQVICDPAFVPFVMSEWLSDATADHLAAHIDREAAAAPIAETIVPSHDDTSYVCVVDRHNCAVSLINSIYSDFGSTLMAPKSGVLLQNRGCGFRVSPGHPNCVAPRKRPLHTIIPGMVMRDGRPVMPFGVVGGHYQVVGHAQLLHGVLAEGSDVQTTLNRSRSFCLDGTLQLETTHAAETFKILSSMGHRVVPAASPLGGGHAIWVDHERGVLIGGTDSRRDGCVLGH